MIVFDCLLLLHRFWFPITFATLPLCPAIALRQRRSVCFNWNIVTSGYRCWRGWRRSGRRRTCRRGMRAWRRLDDRTTRSCSTRRRPSTWPGGGRVTSTRRSRSCGGARTPSRYDAATVWRSASTPSCSGCARPRRWTCCTWSGGGASALAADGRCRRESRATAQRCRTRGGSRQPPRLVAEVGRTTSVAPRRPCWRSPASSRHGQSGRDRSWPRGIGGAPTWCNIFVRREGEAS